jgi:hypothetical protein
VLASIAGAYVESSRWHAQSAVFSSAAQVSESLRSDGSRRSDQSAAWADVAERFACGEALYETRRARLDDYRRAFCLVPAQLGALVKLNGQVLGLGLFDSAGTLVALLPKLVESSALDAIDAGAADAANEDLATARRFLQTVAEAELQRFPAIGDSADLRLARPRGSPVARCWRGPGWCACAPSQRSRQRPARSAPERAAAA